ncbi:hypothetical protein B0H10DRAFT_1941746 [Mycena sp. CBHHK59/15]|nr:hypothetical protein B0H10DRAFT_1941746 [Mycena sp. CBHHK59/15]
MGTWLRCICATLWLILWQEAMPCARACLSQFINSSLLVRRHKSPLSDTVPHNLEQAMCTLQQQQHSGQMGHGPALWQKTMPCTVAGQVMFMWIPDKLRSTCTPALAHGQPAQVMTLSEKSHTNLFNWVNKEGWAATPPAGSMPWAAAASVSTCT